jgi:hypothetical protein
MNVCPKCGESFQKLGVHWNYCGHPKLSDKQKNLIIGGLLSDATLTSTNSKSSGRPQFVIYNTNKEFLEWYSQEIGFLSNGVRLYEKGENKHKRNIKSGFDEERKANYKDIYCLSTVSHPFNRKIYDSWYKNGKKIYPEELQLTKFSAKIWYCGDGNINWDTKSRGYVEIGCLNEKNNNKKIESYFNNHNIEGSFSSGRLRIYSDSKKFLDWLGEAPSGMEYKWEINNRKRYNKLRKTY